MVTAKFICSYLYRASDNSRLDVYLDPVLEEGKPAGSVSLTLTNPDEYSQFEQGKVYTLTFSEESE
ncbi:hypothetical protein [Raoultella ornithinolytica]|uniref:hypothetical protein n=1 Tax=Raoultella ornithinolytica TaxID=54291 RepID=UPI000E569897|nr:hypothetical protein [Raoultella ornithinolytica]BDA54154.1 hypothetical protein NUITMVR1_18130 [Raoultella ornithinolytica]CAE6333147.1 hypothetical protein AI2711V1_1783 [Raoultella ornithinolytica]CAH3441223.1 hypothetical protein AI2711V1_1783 [Raoultella ornithinolytica]